MSAKLERARARSPSSLSISLERMLHVRTYVSRGELRDETLLNHDDQSIERKTRHPYFQSTSISILRNSLRTLLRTLYFPYSTLLPRPSSPPLASRSPQPLTPTLPLTRGADSVPESTPSLTRINPNPIASPTSSPPTTTTILQLRHCLQNHAHALVKMFHQFIQRYIDSCSSNSIARLRCVNLFNPKHYRCISFCFLP